jgi:hypothetical protein
MNTKHTHGPWIKPLKNGQYAVMPDCAVFDNWALANNYIKTNRAIF